MRVLLVFACVAAASFAARPPAFRLSPDVRPERYRLEMTVLPDRPAFEGRIAIDIDIGSPTASIWLNAKDLAVQSASLQSGSDRLSATVDLRHDEFIGLTFPRPVKTGQATLNIAFSGKLDDKSAVGLYRRSDGREWYAFTTFTAIEARRAFPCFDQPEFKTPWSIALRVRSSDTALSNSTATSETADGAGMKRVTFAETKPLPSEVVAFAVGPFDVVDDGVAGRGRVPVRIIAPKGRGAEAAGARGATREVLARLESYTGIPYPWDKLDHVALLDMPFGAVENPGLITYRDRSLLADVEHDTAEHRRLLRGLMTHEVAHQWFGNLVTQRWWDDVWLSEGFATWLSTKLSDLDVPEWQRGVAAVEARVRVMNSDRRPVRLEMQSRKAMDGVYGQAVYQKAGAILRMIENWLGEEPFRRAVQRYLKSHAYKTATTGDLAAAIQEETGKDVRPVLASYLDQPGFPTLRLTFDCNAKKAAVRQESKLAWSTPVCVGGQCSVVSGAAGEVALDSCPVTPNAGGAGYFRVQGDSIATLVKSAWSTLTSAERLSVIADVAALPPAEQIALLPVLFRDRDSSVLAAVNKVALKLALMPHADLEALRKAVK